MKRKRLRFLRAAALTPPGQQLTYHYLRLTSLYEDRVGWCGVLSGVYNSTLHQWIQLSPSTMLLTLNRALPEWKGEKMEHCGRLFLVGGKVGDAVRDCSTIGQVESIFLAAVDSFISSYHNRAVLRSSSPLDREAEDNMHRVAGHC